MPLVWCIYTFRTFSDMSLLISGLNTACLRSDTEYLSRKFGFEQTRGPFGSFTPYYYYYRLIDCIGFYPVSAIFQPFNSGYYYRERVDISSHHYILKTIFWKTFSKSYNAIQSIGLEKMEPSYNIMKAEPQEGSSLWTSRIHP